MDISRNLKRYKQYFSGLGSAILGRSTTRMVSPDYTGSSTGRRLALWAPGTSNINALVAGHGEVLRSRSRDLVRNNAWANEIKDEWVSNAVGTGIIPDFQHPQESVRKILVEGWKRFVDECDADGMLDFYGLQALACGEIIEGGESLTRIRKRLPGDGVFTPVQLQMLEAEQLPLWENTNAVNGNPIRLGIEFNKALGYREAYHLYREHPGAGVTATTLNASEVTRVPAQFVVHAYRMFRSGQMRGEPWLSRALARLYQFDQFVDATLGRQKLGAFMMGWVTSGMGGLTDTASSILGEETAPTGTKFGAIEPETIVQLSPGEDMKFFDSPEISTQYEQFISSQLREIFASCGMTLEQFDVSKVNYSSIRAGTLKYRRRCEQFQFQTLVFQFCRPITNSWMDIFILSGTADKVADRLGLARIKARDYYQNRDLYQLIEWRTPRWEWVDPAKDVAAEIMMIRGGLKPLSTAIRERGYDPFQVFEQYKRDATLIGNLVFDSDPSRTTQNGQPYAKEAEGGGVGAGAGAGARGTVESIRPTDDDKEDEDEDDEEDEMAARTPPIPSAIPPVNGHERALINLLLSDAYDK